MDLRQLTYFAAVAEEGQFTRAASRLLVAQPAVSAQIRRLERELGEPLFHRDPRSVRLTQAGEALLPHARAALAAAERGRDAIASLRGMLRGRLRIGVAGPVDQPLGQALGELRRAHPDIEVLLTTQNNEPLLEALANGQVDVGIVGIGTQPVPAQLTTRVITSEELALAVSRDHPFAGRKSVTLPRLREEPFVTLVHGSGHREAFDKAFDDAGYRPRIAAEAGELSSLVELVGEGLGAAILPRAAAEGANVAVVDIVRPRLQRRRAIAWNEAGASPAARGFVALTERSFQRAAR
jgi:DNA-binding transcriptional LysR family regulator